MTERSIYFPLLSAVPSCLLRLASRVRNVCICTFTVSVFPLPVGPTREPPQKFQIAWQVWIKCNLHCLTSERPVRLVRWENSPTKRRILWTRLGQHPNVKFWFYRLFIKKCIITASRIEAIPSFMAGCRRSDLLSRRIVRLWRIITLLLKTTETPVIIFQWKYFEHNSTTSKM